jgi:uncharacterized protein (DUF427 family)
MKAIWNGTVLAESDATVIIERNHYFPASALKMEHFRPTATQSTCPWKGVASYYDVVVGDKVNADAAWYYPSTSPEAKSIEGRIAFWKGVQVTE